MVQGCYDFRARAKLESHICTSDTQCAFADPDKIFIYYKSQSRLNKLATTVSFLLKNLLESDELNKLISVKLVQQVKVAIEVSERMKSDAAGFTNTDFYFKWLKSVGRNVLKKNLERLAVVGPTIAGINETIDEMEEELSQVVAKSKNGIVYKLPKDLDVRLLDHQSSKEYVESIETIAANPEKSMLLPAHKCPKSQPFWGSDSSPRCPKLSNFSQCWAA